MSICHGHRGINGMTKVSVTYNGTSSEGIVTESDLLVNRTMYDGCKRCDAGTCRLGAAMGGGSKALLSSASGLAVHSHACRADIDVIREFNGLQSRSRTIGRV